MTNLDDLLARFRAKLPERANRIAYLAKQEANGGDPGDEDLAWREAHKLAGTAGSFGYGEVSSVAKRLEELLRNRSDGQQSAIDDALAKLDTAVREAGHPHIFGGKSMVRIGLVGDSSATAQCVEFLSDESIELVPLDVAAPSFEGLDVVLVDASDCDSATAIPGETALRFLRELRASAGLADLPVILLVGDAELETRVAAAHAGADLILPVPVAKLQLTNAIHMVTYRQADRPVVLALDDDPDALELIACTLQSRFEVVTISDPHQLLSALHDRAPTALLLDFDMPDFTGLQLCASVRLTGEDTHIPIIFVSNRSDRESRLAAFDAGCDDYVNKSQVCSELLHRVSSRIQRTAALRAVTEAATAARPKISDSRPLGATDPDSPSPRL